MLIAAVLHDDCKYFADVQWSSHSNTGLKFLPSYYANHTIYMIEYTWIDGVKQYISDVIEYGIDTNNYARM